MFKQVLMQIVEKYKSTLGNKLVGIYLHGSLAFGCFNPHKSDIDFIVVINKPLAHDEKLILISTLLSAISPKKGFEMSVVLENACKPFIYPTPYELHYSQIHHKKMLDSLDDYCITSNGFDKNLAAHFSVIRHVGKVLYGAPIHDVFGPIPRHIYLDSLKHELKDYKQLIDTNPSHLVISLCRALAFEKDDLVLSKQQGAIWGIDNIPEKYRPLVEKALSAYESDKYFSTVNDIVLNFLDYANSFLGIL